MLTTKARMGTCVTIGICLLNGCGKKAAPTPVAQPGAGAVPTSVSPRVALASDALMPATPSNGTAPANPGVATVDSTGATSKPAGLQRSAGLPALKRVSPDQLSAMLAAERNRQANK